MVTNWDMNRTGGTETLAVRLVRALNAMGHSAFILTPTRGAFALWNQDVEIVLPFEPMQVEKALDLARAEYRKKRTDAGKARIAELEAQVMPKPDAAILMHPRIFPGVTFPEKKVYLALGWVGAESPVMGAAPYVAFSDEVATWLSFYGIESEVCFASVDLDRHTPGPALRATNPRVTQIASRPRDVEIIKRSCERAGFEYVDKRCGAPIRNLPEVYQDVDIVIGTETCIKEAMACGRAAYVLGPFGCDGWVTPTNWRDHERHAFRGTLDPRPLTVDGLAEELSGYSPFMGRPNRLIAEENWDVRKLAARLLEIACG